MKLCRKSKSLFVARDEVLFVVLVVVDLIDISCEKHLLRLSNRKVEFKDQVGRRERPSA